MGVQRRFYDGHLDLAYCALQGRDLCRPLPPDDRGCVTLPALRDANVTVVFATIFTEPVDAMDAEGSADPATYPSGDVEAAAAAGRRQLAFYESLEAAGEVAIVRKRSDLNHNGAQPRLVLLMEGADPIATPDDLAWWADRGLRIVGLTWARGTHYAGGNDRRGPLTESGRAMVEAIDRLGLAHDVSHLADVAVDELLEVATGPIAASHSNCRAVIDVECDGRGNGDGAEGGRQRHLLDRHIRAIAERSGVIGLNLFAPFICASRQPDARDAIRHVEHIASITGRTDCIGLGSDMDGGFDADRLPVDVRGPGQLGRLADVLSERGWSDDAIEGFAWRNWHNFLMRVFPL